MKKPKRKIVKILIWTVAGLLVAVAAVFALILSGIFVKPTEASLAAMTEVPSYDVLEWQQNRESEILADYAAGTYTIQSPYVIMDPYEMNPCSALVIFEGAQAGSIHVTVAGKDAYSTLTYTRETETAPL